MWCWRPCLPLSRLGPCDRTEWLRWTGVQSSLGGEQADSSSAVCGVRLELVSALQAQGGNGQRALSLLLDAAHVLNCPAEFRTPYEVAQSCLRGALDSGLGIAGEDFPGLRSATKAVTETVGAVADAWRRQGGAGCRGS